MYCERCGIALGIARGNVWHADGSITGRYPPYIKATFFDADELAFLFRSLSAFLGHDIGDIVAAGKYRDAREYMAAMVAKMKEASGGKLPPAEELYRMMLYPVCIWGIAKVEITSVEEDRMVIEVERPYSVDLLRGDVAAVADVVTGRAHQAVWEGDEQRGRMTVVPAPRGHELGERLEAEKHYGAKPEARELACPRCEACGAPAAVGELFRWEERCRIEERSSGRRYCFNNTQGITAVLGMLVSELGEEVEMKMAEIAREYSRSLYAGRKGFELAAELDSFPYRGWGKASEVSTAPGPAMEVENPYNPILLLGRIWGMGEAATGNDLRLAERAEEGGVLRLAFEP